MVCQEKNINKKTIKGYGSAASPVRAMGSHCGRERRKATPKLVLKFYDSCYGGKQSYRSLFFYQSY